MDILIKKSNSGRPKIPPLSDYAIKFLTIFVEKSGGLRVVSKYLNVSHALVWCWLHRRARPSWQHAKKIEEISKGEVTQEMLYLTDEDLIGAPELLRDYINENFIYDQAKIADLTPDEYYNNFVPFFIRKIIDNNYIKDHEIPILVAFFGKSFAFWRTVMLLYPLRKKMT